jgi:hypothetical protein
VVLALIGQCEHRWFPDLHPTPIDEGGAFVQRAEDLGWELVSILQMDHDYFALRAMNFREPVVRLSSEVMQSIQAFMFLP